MPIISQFYGIIIKKDEYEYCIPFTSKVKKRNSKLTINIKNKNKIIAQLLLNNMIPVTEKCTRLVEIEKEKYVDYLKSEIIYLFKYFYLDVFLWKLNGNLGGYYE